MAKSTDIIDEPVAITQVPEELLRFLVHSVLSLFTNLPVLSGIVDIRYESSIAIQSSRASMNHYNTDDGESESTNPHMKGVFQHRLVGLEFMTGNMLYGHTNSQDRLKKLFPVRAFFFWIPSTPTL